MKKAIFILMVFVSVSSCKKYCICDDKGKHCFWTKEEKTEYLHKTALAPLTEDNNCD